MKLVVMVSVLMSTLASALADVASGDFTNGDFENAKKPSAGWSLPGKGWRIAKGEGRKGSFGLVWENADPTYYAFPICRIPLEPGGVYRFGAWVKVDGDGQKLKPAVSLDWSSADGKWLGASYAHPIVSNEPGTEGWVRYEGVSRPLPATAARGNVLCYLPRGSVGKVRFDDFILIPQAARPVEFLQCSAYHNAFCDDDGLIRFAAALHVNTVKTPLETLKAVFTLKQADGCVSDRLATVFDAEQAEVSIAATDFALGTQDVVFRIVDRDGKALGEIRRKITKTVQPVKRRVSIDRFKRVLLDGKPFFPFGMYTGRMSDDDLLRWKEAGFNFAMQYGAISRSDLDRWQSVGTYAATDVRSLIHGYNYSAKSKYRTPEESQAAFRKKFQEIGDHPALLAWYLVDEAPLEFVPNITMANEFLHEIDPDHPTYTVTDKPWDARSLLPCYDVIGMDPYPIGNHGGRTRLSICSGWAEDTRKGMFDFRAMWHVPQAFNWGWYRPDEVGKTPNLRFPTRGELANMTWQGIAAGANGICAYSFRAIQRNLKGAEYDAAWGSVCSVTKEVRSQEDVLLSVGSPIVIGDVPKELVVRTYDHDGKAWALVVNRTDETVRARLRLPRPFASMKVVCGDGVKLAGDVLEVDFERLGYALVALQPSSEM